MTRREQYRKGLNGLYLPIYDALCELLPDYFQPYCGLRTVEHQDKLFAIGRNAAGVKIGQTVTNARGGFSAHNFGCATDWCLWDDNGTPLNMKDDKPEWNKKDRRWKEYGSACDKAGATWLGPAIGDYPHNELPLAIPWGRVGLIFKAEGMEAALKFIAENKR